MALFVAENHKDSKLLKMTAVIPNTFSPPPKSIQFFADKQEIDSKDVVLLVGNINYTYIYLQCGKVILSTQTLKKFEEPLIKLGFWRVHKSAIINPAFMDNYASPSEIKMLNGVLVRVSRRRKININTNQII